MIFSFKIISLLFLMDIIIGAGMSAILFLMLKQRYVCPGARWWSYSLLTISCGMAFLLARLFIPISLSVSLGNSFLLLGFIFYWFGFRQYTRTNKNWDFILLVFPLLLAITLGATTTVDPHNIALRVKVASPSIIVICLLTIFTALSNLKKQDSGTIISVIGLLLIIFMMIYRYIFAEKLADSGNFNESSPAVLMVFLIGISLLLLGFSILMCNYQWLIRRLHTDATRDALTGVLNRNALLEQYETLELTGKLEINQWSVVLIDIDYFKQVNDAHGHQVGDQVLKHIAQRLVKIIRHDDILARYGGEEFIAVLPKCDSTYATKWARRLSQAVSCSPITVGNITLDITISVGVATANENSTTLDELISNADKALYEAKNTGRNRICFYEFSDNQALNSLFNKMNNPNEK